jgi:hypothetical protein
MQPDPDDPPATTDAAAPRARARRRARTVVPLLVLALAAAAAWLAWPKGAGPAREEHAVALPRPPPPAETPPAAAPPAAATPPHTSATLPIAPAPPAATAPTPPVAAAGSPPAAPRAAVASADANAPPSLLPPTLDGFGSARFDMTEAEVRAAIDRDFPAAASGPRRVGDIDVEANRVFLTRSLMSTVQDVLPASGPARIEYVLGYQRHGLIQVNVIWAASADPPTPPAAIDAVSAQLRDFVARTYGPNLRTVATQPDGSLVHFVGRDRQGRMVELAASARAPQWLRLSFVQDPLTGDIYRLPRGAF